MLLALAAESNALPHNTLVHLPWAWRLAALPDAYIPAMVQEALLLVMGEREASALLRAVVALTHPGQPQAENRTANAGVAPEQDPPEPSSSSSSSSSSAFSSLTHCKAGSCGRLWLDPFSVENVLLQPAMFRPSANPSCAEHSAGCATSFATLQALAPHLPPLFEECHGRATMEAVAPPAAHVVVPACWHGSGSQAGRPCQVRCFSGASGSLCSKQL